ncbi:lipocalin family protein [Mucilaginibacter auburnensis]|uniref:Lipocalin-like protein n=1 Tax=Mucilaginibacter auburnensis TaxID=1457233 RepID=A0A2H9VNG8_9SPHI|nr:lipocalin family protein [Mucilaginibacter auburnensis]PJJ79877.1 hypothetical protein CLV57_3016 [Mucilaginibacter auburnensis]
MKNVPLIFILCLLLLSMLTNSCKKDKGTSIQNLFSSGKWELTTVVVTVTQGDSVKYDTLNTDCPEKQLFTLNADGTCNYTNFHCKTQISNGRWSLSPDQLYLKSDIVCQDTVKLGPGKSTPFSNAQILTVGQYSMVLITGDIQNYSNTQKRTVMRYGFVKQKVITQ